MYLFSPRGVGVGLVRAIRQADRLLELGFQEEVAELVKSCPVGRQTLLFSATMNTKVDDLVSLALNKVGWEGSGERCCCRARVEEVSDLVKARFPVGSFLPWGHLGNLMLCPVALLLVVFFFVTTRCRQALGRQYFACSIPP